MLFGGHQHLHQVFLGTAEEGARQGQPLGVETLAQQVGSEGEDAVLPLIVRLHLFHLRGAACGLGVEHGLEVGPGFVRTLGGRRRQVVGQLQPGFGEVGRVGAGLVGLGGQRTEEQGETEQQGAGSLVHGNGPYCCE
ncbi:hypothetical protein D3C84_1038870 [compost metagenome]